MNEKIDLKAVAEAALAEDEVSSAQECVFDAGIFTMSLEEHDRRYHGGCYKPGSYCAYRDWLRKYEGVDQLLSKGSLGELRQRFKDLESDIWQMNFNNDRIVAKERMELFSLNRKKDSGQSMTEAESARRIELSKDIFRRIELSLYTPHIARARMVGGGKRSKMNIGNVDGIPQEQIEAARTILEAMVNPSIMPKHEIDFRVLAKKRAESTGNVIFVPPNSSAVAIVHEFGHVLEYNNSNILKACIAFLDYRCRGEKSQLLSKLTGEEYGDDEFARPDKFFEPYCGKDYFLNGKRCATEILSKWMEQVVQDAEKFIDEDPEYFKFGLNIIRGQI